MIQNAEVPDGFTEVLSPYIPEKIFKIESPQNHIPYRVRNISGKQNVKNHSS
jgi:hypothetical protein